MPNGATAAYRWPQRSEARVAKCSNRLHRSNRSSQTAETADCHATSRTERIARYVTHRANRTLRHAPNNQPCEKTVKYEEQAVRDELLLSSHRDVFFDWNFPENNPQASFFEYFIESWRR